MKKKLCIISLMILILINIITMSVSAAALSFTISMTANNTKIEPGTEVVVSVKISSLDVGDEGINTFSAQLGYDASIFEPLTETNVEGSNNWKAAYATGTGKVTLTNSSFVNSDEEIMQITLKVKNDAPSGSKGTVSLSNVLAANPETEISSSNVSTTVTIGEANNSNLTEKPETPVNVITPTNNIINNGVVNNGMANNTVNKVNNGGTLTPITNGNNTNNRVNIVNNAVNQVDESNDDMPYTGSETESFMKIILGMIIIALLIYRKIYSLEDI